MTSASIRSMAGMLHPPSSRKRVIVALRAYFDESGTHWAGPMACDTFVLCGYVAPASVWDDATESSFNHRWSEVMHGKPFHAREMESNPQGPAVKIALANVVRNSGLIGIAGGISISAFRKIVQPHIERQRASVNPYLLLFADVICEAIKWGEIFVGESKDEPIGFVFASHPRWSAEALDFYNLTKAGSMAPDDLKCRMGAVAFDDANRFIPLQAADHLAFESYHFMEDGPGTRRPAMNLLLDWPQNHGVMYREKELEMYVEQARKRGIL